MKEKNIKLLRYDDRRTTKTSAAFFPDMSVSSGPFRRDTRSEEVDDLPLNTLAIGTCDVSILGLAGSADSAVEDVSDPLYIASWTAGPRAGADVEDEKLPLPPKSPPSLRDSGSLAACREAGEVVSRLGRTGELDSPAPRNRPPKPHREPPFPPAFFLSASSPRIAGLPTEPTSTRTDGTPTLFSAIKSRRVFTQVSDASRASFASVSSFRASSRADLSAWISRCSFSLSTGLEPGTGSNSVATARPNRPETRRLFVGGQPGCGDGSGRVMVCEFGEVFVGCAPAASDQVTPVSDTEDIRL